MENLVETLKNRMKSEIVSFSYMKKDGTIRNAKGTTSPDILVSLNASRAIPSGSGRELSTDNTRYYDVDSEGWRSFVNENLVEIFE